MHFSNESEISRVRDAPMDEAVSFSIRVLTPSGPVAFEMSMLLGIAMISSCVIGMSLCRASVLSFIVFAHGRYDAILYLLSRLS